jgi:BirA family biotin operon repressor/biotin-[acetyl-CoA-carboxylase] ligase
VLEKSSLVVPKLIFHETVDSTNAELERMDRKDLPEFTAVVAMSQSAGQGRLGRAWVSEPGASISVSILLRPKATPAQIGWLTLLTAAAVRASAELLGVGNAKIKWPNDVLVGEKKISGILARLHQGDLILGVGINLKPQSDAPDHATSLSEQGAEFDFDEVLATLLTQLRGRYLKFLADPELAIRHVGQEFQEHSSTLGNMVRAILPDETEVIGTAVGLDSSGNLLIQGNQLHTISAADIIHLRN